MMMVPKITFFLLTLYTICYGDNPGVNIQITEHGLKKGVEYLLNNMMSNDTAYQLPDVTGTEKIALTDVAYAFTEVRIVNFQHGTILSQWTPETGMQITVENNVATINCDWKLDSWLLKDSGSSVLTLSGLSISLVLGVQRIDPGLPFFYLHSCQSGVENVDVQMIGGISFIVDNMKEPVQKVVRQNVNQQLCSSIGNQVTKLDQWISHLRFNSSIHHLIELDLSLVGHPEISKQYANIGLKGLFRTHNESHSETAFSPSPMTLPVHDGAMLYTGVSQASLDSLCSVCYSTGLLNLEISHTVDSKKLTTADLAAYMPEISQRFPNPAPVKIQMYPTRPPRVLLQPNNITVQYGATIRTYVYPSKASICSVDIMADFQATMSLSEAIEAEGLNLTGSMSLISLQIDGSQPTTAGQTGIVTKDGVERLLHQVVMPFFNEQIREGYLIPSSFVKNASVSIEQDCVMWAADLK
ncbi:BPI fold-containing family C protein-like isoform X1 [Eleutherodactylus coqui]|uniref:BPI fold-containing family C protein-like isoform X1 n=1 Tax=Eleutherodactylus coqui TaxID=57060 RepID=UPI0034633C6D